MIRMRITSSGLAAAGLLVAGGLAFAAGQYGPGASDTEIKIGNTMPYSGPASAYGVIGKTEAAYFNMVNEQGRHQRPQDQLHLAATTVTARRRLSNRCAGSSRRIRCVHVQHPRHAAQHRGARLH